MASVSTHCHFIRLLSDDLSDLKLALLILRLRQDVQDDDSTTMLFAGIFKVSETAQIDIRTGDP